MITSRVAAVRVGRDLSFHGVLKARLRQGRSGVGVPSGGAPDRGQYLPEGRA